MRVSMQEVGWEELVGIVRRRLNDKQGSWKQIAADLAKVEGGQPTTCYRWLREFSDAHFHKVDGGKLARLAQVLAIPVRFSVPLARDGLSGTRRRLQLQRRGKGRG